MSSSKLSLLFPLILTASLATASESASPTDSASVERGKKVYMTCAACHSVDPKAGAIVGPNLASVLNRPIGKEPGFRYSAALQKAKGKWTPAALDAFIASPMEAQPGTSMAFAGIKKNEDRAALIAYLKHVSGDKK